MHSMTRTAAQTAILIALAASPALAGEKQSQGYNTLGESVGLVGYDPVSYFPEGGGKPTKGSIKISTEHDGVTYRFANEQHLALFKKSPEKYLPQYGGWCAWAVAELGKRVDVDPLSYEIRGNRLYLFYKDPGLDTRAMSLAKLDEIIRKADARWPTIAR
jgi:YHS domain-containing protein